MCRQIKLMLHLSTCMKVAARPVLAWRLVGSHRSNGMGSARCKIERGKNVDERRVPGPWIKGRTGWGEHQAGGFSSRTVFRKTPRGCAVNTVIRHILGSVHFQGGETAN